MLLEVGTEDKDNTLTKKAKHLIIEGWIGCVGQGSIPVEGPRMELTACCVGHLMP